jgi:hypothetical protein
MKERVEKLSYTTIPLGPEKKLPLAVRAMATDPNVAGLIKDLGSTGATISFKTLRRIPEETRRVVHGATNSDRIIERALVDESVGRESPINKVKVVIQNAFVFSATAGKEKPLISKQRVLLDQLNSHPVVEKRREQYVRTRLKYDRPQEVTKRFKIAGGVIGVSTVVTEISEVFFGHIGKIVGLLLAQSTDDAMNAYIVPATEKGGKKKLPQIISENKSLIPILIAAAVADYTIIPQLLESPSVSARVIGGVLFSAAAVGGSVGTNVLHFHRTNKEIKKTEQDISRGERWKKAWSDHLSDPFRKRIWYGASASLVASMGAAAGNILIGKEYSGLLQMGIGMMESMPAFAGLLLENPVTTLKRNVKDLLTITSSKKPAQIFFEKK